MAFCLDNITFPSLEDPSLPILVSGVGAEDVLFTLFAGVGTLAVACQFIPGIILFSSMIRSIVTCPRVETGNSETAG